MFCLLCLEEEGARGRRSEKWTETKEVHLPSFVCVGL